MLSYYDEPQFNMFNVSRLAAAMSMNDKYFCVSVSGFTDKELKVVDDYVESLIPSPTLYKVARVTDLINAMVNNLKDQSKAANEEVDQIIKIGGDVQSVIDERTSFRRRCYDDGIMLERIIKLLDIWAHNHQVEYNRLDKAGKVFPDIVYEANGLKPPEERIL